MKLASALLALLVFSLPVMSQTLPAKLSDLSWLAGCWEMKNEGRGLQITEMWMKPAGDAMIGVGRTMKNGKLADYEFLRIVVDETGFAYISQPRANKGDTTFKLISYSSDALVFENPAHDFPQRIMYKRNGDKLTARIEGTSNGKIRGVDFPYTRIECR